MTMTLDDRVHFKLLVPEDNGEIEIFDTASALRMAVIERGVSVDADWDAPGVYLLLDAPGPDGTWSVYVGKAPSGIAGRVRQHKNKDNWRRAILIQRDSRFGFNSAEVGWLEGRLWDLMKAAENASLTNQQRPRDDTLPAHELRALESMVEPITGVLRVIGNDPAPRPDDEYIPATRGPKKVHMHSTKIKDLLKVGLLKEGATLVSTSPGAPAEAVINKDGTLRWADTDYSTPSAAGCAVREGKATNGWNFWAVQTETGAKPLAVLRAKHEEGTKT